jgi:hypothetical protein
MTADRRHEAARRPVRYDLPETRDARIEKGIPYRSGSDSLTLDLYHAVRRDGPSPSVLLVTGLSDIGATRMLGCRINETDSYISWGRLIAASGLTAITYTTAAEPVDNTADVLEHLRTHGRELGIDVARVGLHATSSHVPNALGQVIRDRDRIACAVLSYGFMLDLDDQTGVAEAQKTWRFVNPAAGRSVADLSPNVPLFVVRAGRDQFPGVNQSIDAFARHALRENLPMTIVNHPTGMHAFDLEEDSEASRQIIGQMLAFLRTSLAPVERSDRGDRGRSA